MKTFQVILKGFREGSATEREKGGKFEKLMKGYLLTSPIYKTTIKTVWMWNEFPFRSQFGGSDLGIDLVALTYDGEYWSVQCKCYLETTEINKAEVDSFIATSGKTFRTDSRLVNFSHRLWISTTNKWGANAEQTIANQTPPVNRISLYDLENDAVDWEALEKGVFGDAATTKKFDVREHQQRALDSAKEYFQTHDRGKMIMACGTGKTFTSLRLAEQETGGKGLVLFMVPSIALLGQMLREWSAQAINKIYPICICSDAGVVKKVSQKEDESYSMVDLALPASTDVNSIVTRLRFAQKTHTEGMIVVFSTYQSIDVISEAQKRLLEGDGMFDKGGDFGVFDLIICDEAHRTTGVTLKGFDDSNFVKVHYNDFIKAKKRVYMTATPRLFTDEAKSKADAAEAVLCSMDDVNLYGEEFFRIGFGEAVEKGLLSDYKVLILTINDENISPTLRNYLTDANGEVNADDGGKIVGCINALSKKIIGDAQDILKTDAEPMRKAVAFCSTIKKSQETTDLLNNCKDKYLADLTEEEKNGMVDVVAQHIDGSMSAPVREEKLAWLKGATDNDNECRILTNVRCLSEGVDVPSLDAVLFLSPRNSQVDVVQSVGRVMRTAAGKKYGYIIIPVVIPSDMDANEAMDNSDRFKVVWTVLNALRAHDDRFEATVNKIELNKKKPKQVMVGGVLGGIGENDEWGYNNEIAIFDEDEVYTQLEIQFEELSNTFFAKMVQKVGDKRYWEQWATDVATIATEHINRIKRLIAEEGKPKREFERFIKGLRKNINPSISEEDAIEMLSQHIITKPVFEALFDNYSFVGSNPISKSMQKVLDLIEEQTPEEENAKLETFYDSVRRRAKDIDNAESKQKVIVELYDKFFKAAFPKVVEKLGIVYTPTEVVDYIVKSVAWILKKEFYRDISDENIHVLDPFTGTGTFITRLLQSGVISNEALARKYDKEIHANEIVLLAYYIASINIENVYHDIAGEEDGYKSFNGICLTDTFQLGEDSNTDNIFSDVFPFNSKRVQEQKKKPITVIIGNPPYSVGQKSANDNAQNQDYPTLNSRIEQTYAVGTKANSIKALYDSYIKAFRWSTDRIGKDGGVIGFVTNGSWLDGNGMDGFRKCLEKEFTSIYVFNLRGNQRTSGEISRREGGKIFGSGSRTPIAITILVKKPNVGKDNKAVIHYHDIGDYLSREDKLRIIKNFDSIANPAMDWKILEPNEHGDWINHRKELFGTFIPIEPEKKFDLRTKAFFTTYSLGIATARDAWVYNFSKKHLMHNVSDTIAFYNNQRESFLPKRGEIDIEDFVDRNPQKISWNDSLISDCGSNKVLSFDELCCREGVYRAYCKEYLYYDKSLIQRQYQTPKLLPTKDNTNLLISVSGIGGSKPFSALITNTIPNLHFTENGQNFPLYWYEDKRDDVIDLFNQTVDDSQKYERKDGISDWILRECKQRYGNKVTKEDIFYYVYGILHSPEYRTAFEADLKKMLPRLPLVDTPEQFFAFSQAGRKLADLHLNYETVQPYEGVNVKIVGTPNYEVQKMRFGKKDSKTADKSIIFYNPQITIENIPLEAYDYVVNGKSAIEWIMERYQITTDAKSGITNNPNDWSREHNDEKYIFNLLLRIITVSIETMKIVSELPKLEFGCGTQTEPATSTKTDNTPIRDNMVQVREEYVGNDTEEPQTKENTLYLVMMKVYFDAIVAGTKKVEYREIKDTTARRYLKTDKNGSLILNAANTVEGKSYSLYAFNGGRFPFIPKNIKYLNLAVGYNKERDTATVQVSRITFRYVGKMWIAEFHIKKVVSVERKNKE
jgi:predicted helicase